MDVEDSPLEWWKVEHSQYLRLAKLANKYLCLCATSVPSECVFSCAGQIVSDHKSTLKPNNVDNLHVGFSGLKSEVINLFCYFFHRFL